MAGNEPSAEEIHPVRSTGKRYRHKFSTEALQILQLAFENDPYPCYSEKEALARLFQCEVNIINTWFQNRRARLPPRERRRVLATRRWRQFPAQGAMPLSYQIIQEPPTNRPSEQPTFHGQDAQQSTADHCSLGTLRVPNGHDVSCNTVTPGMNMQPNHSLPYQGGPGSGLPFSYTPAGFISPAGFAQYGMNDRFEAGESQLSMLWHPHQVPGPSVQGQGQQQEEQMSPYHSLFNGQQPIGYGCDPWQLQQPQPYLDNYQFPSSNQFVESQSQLDLGQLVASLPPLQHSGGAVLCPENQQAFLPTDARSPPVPSCPRGAMHFCTPGPISHAVDFQGSSAGVQCWDQN